MASKEEWDEYYALQLLPEIEAGRATIADLPEQYGGMPQGTTRRAVRMREAWKEEQTVRRAFEEEAIARENYERELAAESLKQQALKYTIDKQREQDLFNSKIEATRKMAEAEFSKFINDNELNPSDPASASAIAGYMATRPILAESEDAKKTFYYFEKAASNSSQSLAAQQQNVINSKISELRQLGVPERLIEANQTIDEDGNIRYDANRLQALADITKGNRVLEEEKRKGQGDIRSPLQKAQDDLAESQAALSVFEEKDEYGEPIIEKDSPEYASALKDARRKEARVKSLAGESEEEDVSTTAEPQQYSEEQINEVKRIAKDSKNPRSRAAIRFLNSIGESY